MLKIHRAAFLSFWVWVTCLAPLYAAEKSTLPSASNPNSAGIILGEPTGFTLKHELSPHNAIVGGLAFSFSNFILFYGDYLWTFPKGFASSKGASPFANQLTPYAGLGGTLFISTQSGRIDGKFYTSGGSSVGVGVRLPLGIEWRPGQPPMAFFVELAPGVGLIPSTFGFVQGGVGARWFF